MKIEAMPTRFKGINFRSRLEAKWAHVFERLQWDWLYEPIDMDGWLPDFLIRCRGKRDLLIDIKPISSFRADLPPVEVIKKLDDATIGAEYHLAILGLQPQGDDRIIGWLSNWNYPESTDRNWERAVFCTSFDDYEGERRALNQIGLCQTDGGSFHDVISGQHSKGSLFAEHERVLDAAFNEATNRVQWNPKTPRHIADAIGEFRL